MMPTCSLKMNFRILPCISAAVSLKLSICFCAKDKDFVSKAADESLPLLPFPVIFPNSVRKKGQHGPTEMFPSQYFKGLSSRYSFATASNARSRCRIFEQILGERASIRATPPSSCNTTSKLETPSMWWSICTDPLMVWKEESEPQPVRPSSEKRAFL